MRALDLYCKQGGASAGLAAAGFDVTGVDKDPQPHYPYRFIQADALTVDLAGYDFFWASPPCQRYSPLAHLHHIDYPDLVAPTRERLLGTGKPFIIENVPGAPLLNPITLCGTMFGLKIRRHRLFECHPPVYPLLPPCACAGRSGFTNAHRGVSSLDFGARLLSIAGHNFHVEEAREVMHLPWMTQDGLREAIPPIYATFLATEIRRQRTDLNEEGPAAVGRGGAYPADLADPAGNALPGTTS